jgi:hypothetical protein
MVFRFAILAASLALSGCSTVPFANDAAMASARSSPQESAAAASGPPMVDGVYTYADCEGEGGCPFRNWRTIELTPVLQQQVTTALVIGELAPGEWIHVEAVETKLSPRRGIVRGNAEGLRTGDVIYALENEGEGFTAIWNRGETGSLSYDTQVDWEDKPAPSTVAAKLGLWAKVRRENGQVGWVHDPRFECMGKLAGDEGCRN